MVWDAELHLPEPRRQIMGMASPSRFWTADTVRTLPDDGRRYETVRGELLVTPSPGVPHQRAVLQLAWVLQASLGSDPGIEVLTSPADIELDPTTLVQPDVFVTRRIRSRPPAWRDVHLLLAVEVLSPSTARYDRVIKRARYQEEGVEYWVVDLDSRVIERWRPGDDRPEIVTHRILWNSPESPGTCEMDLPALFAAILGE